MIHQKRQWLKDLSLTLLCWGYFTLGFLLFFSPLYLGAFLFARSRETFFQKLNHHFYRIFFVLLRRLTPRQLWDIDPALASLSNAVVVCNHRSYLDPVLLISLFRCSKTVVKPTFFSLPIFSVVLRCSGFFPANGSGQHGGLLLQQLENMPAYLENGGIFFLFPEGTRNRGQGVLPLHPGAMKMVRQIRKPIYVVCLHNTDRLFIPGRFVFSTKDSFAIRVQIVDRIDPDRSLSVNDYQVRIRSSLEQALIDIEVKGKG